MDQIVVDQLVDKLRIHGKNIGLKAATGDKNAQSCISWFEKFRKRPDPSSYVLCEHFLMEYCKDEGLDSGAKARAVVPFPKQPRAGGSPLEDSLRAKDDAAAGMGEGDYGIEPEDGPGGPDSDPPVDLRDGLWVTTRNAATVLSALACLATTYQPVRQDIVALTNQLFRTLRELKNYKAFVAKYPDYHGVADLLLLEDPRDLLGERHVPSKT